MLKITNIHATHFRHPGEGRGPWIPAFAGMTEWE